MNLVLNGQCWPRPYDLSQRPVIYFGVDCCYLRTTVAQQLPGLFQRSPTSQDSGRYAVAKPMSPNTIFYPGPTGQTRHHHGDRDRTQRLIRCPGGQKHVTVRRIRTPMPMQIRGNGLTDLSRDRHDLAFPAFAMYPHRPGMPHEVINTQTGDLTGPQPKAYQEKDDCPVPSRHVDGQQGCNIRRW